MDTNVLYYGDNLDILRKHIPDDSIDLVYLDPPFNSKASYNVLFEEPTGKPSQAQLTAFEDTWSWKPETQQAWDELISSQSVPIKVKELMRILPTFLGQRSSMMAYLVMMCIRLIELKRVLKDTGSIYLHCDLTAGHYLKILMDAIFNAENFVNEIIWQRIRTTKAQTNGFGNVIDVILFYKKSGDFIFYPQHKQLDSNYVDSHYKNDPTTGKQYRTVSLLQKGDGPSRSFSGTILEPPKGRHWIWSQERIDEAMKNGLIRFTSNGRPEKIQYLEDSSSDIVDNLWSDIYPINSQAKERLPYPTQKPEKLLERILSASSKKDDVVLDPFCGCGTTLVVAQRLHRRWIGIDITHLAISVLKYRLEKLGVEKNSIKVIGEPKDLTGARELSVRDKYEFQYWTIDKIGGQPYGDKKKGSDTGIDGFLYFMDDNKEVKRAIISVKGGKNIHVDMVRDLGHVIDREKSNIGVLITLENPTKPMESEAIQKGYYKSPSGLSYPRIQILTVEDILNGKRPNLPSIVPTIQVAPTKKTGKQGKML